VPAGLPFDIDVPGGGYAWWYIDAVSHDGLYGITLIAFVGSVFSPRYRKARGRDPAADPMDFCAFNVALYAGGRRRWAFTEWPPYAVHRSPQLLRLGPNEVRWRGDSLEVRFDERAVPLGGWLNGTLRLFPAHRSTTAMPLDPEGQHLWYPVATGARVEVELDSPRLRFVGHGYHDANLGSAGLESAFAGWTWSRAAGPAGTTVTYDVTLRSGAELPFSALFRTDGGVEPVTLPHVATLPTGRWGVARSTRTLAGAEPRLVRSLEDSPFYTRDLISTGVAGAPPAVHESVDLRRFPRRWVQRLLPFRMRRR
jgi:carotenoid 1,2-hydratase